MLGAIVGDIVGSIYEFNNHRSKNFPFFGEKNFFTDDTVCTVALADALLRGADPAKTLHEWCNRYPGRGYGGRFLYWVTHRDLAPYMSYGNGAAMRVSAAGWLGSTLKEALALADRITEITHNHPQGMKGARAVTHAIFLARDGTRASVIRRVMEEEYHYDVARTVDDIRPVYRFDETCQHTVPEALVCALTAIDFEDAVRNAVSIGGDSDTLAAIAGSVAEPLFGIPVDISHKAKSYLPEEMINVLDRFRQTVRKRR